MLWPDSWLDSFPGDVGAEGETGVGHDPCRMSCELCGLCVSEFQSLQTQRHREHREGDSENSQMAIDVTCECGREFGVTNDSVGPSVKCPECGSWVRVSEEFVAVEQERGTSDLANDPEHQTPKLRLPLPGLSLTVTETGWRFVASTRSLTEALPILMGGTPLVALIGFFAWSGRRQQLPSGAFWLAPLLLAGVLVIVCLGAMRLFGRIEITVEGNQGREPAAQPSAAATSPTTSHCVWRSESPELGETLNSVLSNADDQFQRLALSQCSADKENSVCPSK